MMNDIQQSTLDYMVDQYDVGRPKPFKEANHFDLYTIHMMREIMNMEPSDETKEVAQAFIGYVTQSNLTLHNLHNKS
jgi:phage anti-repressor protein|tara:strand:+ start:5494 stop:5724 length:231 start_codon:yes stop_codon:yes gene_type:complete